MELPRKFDAPREFHWDQRPEYWAIRFGESRFLLAEGSGWSTDFGRSLFEALIANG
jgi:hypothetical protein